jgi:sortase A
MLTRRLTDIVMAALCLLALFLGADAMSIKLKAWLAPILIQSAWEETLQNPGSTVKPWPWADTWPVARIEVPSHAVDLPVLYGDAGNSLAFAPGLAAASATPGRKGVAVVSAHRDTHFAFLEHVSIGQTVRLQLTNGQWRSYEIVSIRVADSSKEGLTAMSDEETLLLVTCYPFGAVQPGGPLRYVVRTVLRQA